MGSRRLSFTFISVLSFGAFLLLLEHFAESIEFRREVTCYNDVLHLDCGNLSFIAIHEAYFTTDVQENQTCHSPILEHDYIEDEDMVTEATNYSSCYEDIRVPLNRKCSGQRNCSYSYNQEPGKMCFIQEGSFVVRYDCVRDITLNKFCKTKIQTKEGYIASPGFPSYYPYLEDCIWSVAASDGQTIFTKILHLHVRPAVEVGPTVSDPDSLFILGQLMTEPTTRCDDDSLTVLEGNVKRLVACGEDLQSLKTIEVDGSSGLTHKFKSVEFWPASGFLAYFKVEGCPTLAEAEGSYLVERNGSAAVYACHGDQVFNDTLENTRFLRCIRDHHWNDTLPSCTSLEDITTTITPNKIIELKLENNTYTSTETTLHFIAAGTAFLEDIIIPSILVGVLIIGNAIIISIIFCLRRDQRARLKEEEEEDLKPSKSQPLVADLKDV